MKAPTRVLVAVLLIGLVVAMGVHYDTRSDDHWPYPSTDDLATEYDQHVGERTFVTGTVKTVDRDAGTVQIQLRSSTGPFTVTVRNVDVDVSEGGAIQVLGTLRSNHVVAAQDVAVVNPSGASELYKYAVSVVGALLIVVLFFKHWRVNPKTFAFEARYDG